MLYCDLEDTGRVFKNKKIYKCQKCGLEAGLEDPNAEILCMTKGTDLHKLRMAEMEEAMTKARKEHEKDMEQSEPFPTPEGFTEAKSAQATEEQINNRMDICKVCDHYKDDSCLLCGCRVVRDTVHHNKLADKSASCPDGRWGPITED